MCYLARARYSCGHFAPLHSPAHKRSLAKDDVAQIDLKTEFPTHPHTTIEGCQDAGRRGTRCSGPLEELEVIEKQEEGLCQECEDGEWVVIE